MTEFEKKLFVKQIREAVAAMEPWVRTKPTLKLPPEAGRPVN